jgi:hypothetical protein
MSIGKLLLLLVAPLVLILGAATLFLGDASDAEAEALGRAVGLIYGLYAGVLTTYFLYKRFAKRA